MSHFKQWAVIICFVALAGGAMLSLPAFSQKGAEKETVSPFAGERIPPADPAQKNLYKDGYIDESIDDSLREKVRYSSLRDKCTLFPCAGVVVKNNTDSTLRVQVMMEGNLQNLGNIKPRSEIQFQNSLPRGVTTLFFFPADGQSNLNGRMYLRRQMVVSTASTYTVTLNPGDFKPMPERYDIPDNLYLKPEPTP